MPLHKYGVLAGKAVAARREDNEDTPHYQVEMRASSTHYRIAVNVRSSQQPPDLLYLIKEDFGHPILARLTGLPEEFTPLPPQPAGMALDFIRGNLFDRSEMRLLPSQLPGPDNDLSDRIEHYVKRAIDESDAVMYAFGQRWGPEQGVRDKVFDFEPGNGIHDIHMNQGNSAAYRQDDGVWQDGGLILHFPATDQWVAAFLAFQSQAWHTDDATGHAIGPRRLADRGPAEAQVLNNRKFAPRRRGIDHGCDQCARTQGRWRQLHRRTSKARGVAGCSVTGDTGPARKRRRHQRDQRVPGSDCRVPYGSTAHR